MSVLGYFSGSLFIRPVRKLIQGVKNIINGDLDTPVQISSSDELGVLAKSFNQMAANLNTKIYQLNNEISVREKIQSELQKYKDNLEEIVKQRTTELRKEILDHQKTATELVHAKERAELANQAKSDFISSMSHEIRTPINAILGFSEILQGTIHDPIQAEYLCSISVSGKLLLNLINDILDLAKVESGKLDIQLADVNLEYTIDEVLSIFNKKAADKGLEIRVEVDPDIPEFIRLDNTRIRQILINLIGNAIKFTDKGFVKIFCFLKRKADLHNLDIDLCLGVEDTGKGIPSDQVDSIFESFVQVKGQDQNKYGGTGLGLSISKKLVEFMGGQIIVESVAEKGSIFTLDLPAIEVSRVGAEKKSTGYNQITESLEFEPSTVLIAEDNIFNRNLLKAYLDGTNLRLIYAENGLETLKLVEKEKPAIVLLDYTMPVLNGLEVLKKLRENHDESIRQTPVILITATAWSDSVDDAKKMSDNFVLRPFDRRTFFDTIKEFLPHKRLERLSAELQPAVFDFSIKPAKADSRKLARLMNILHEQIIPRLDKLGGFQVMSEIEIFSQDMINLGNRYDHNELKAWASELNKFVCIYDSDSISRMLAGFPGVMAKWESQLTGLHGKSAGKKHGGNKKQTI